MECRALQWHKVLIKSRVGRGLISWNDYVRPLHFRFGHTLYDDPMSELIESKQTGIVQEFLDQFDALLDEVELSEEYSINYFLEKVKPEIEVQVRMLEPRTLMKAYSLAKLVEHSLEF